MIERIQAVSALAFLGLIFLLLFLSAGCASPLPARHLSAADRKRPQFAPEFSVEPKGDYKVESFNGVTISSGSFLGNSRRIAYVFDATADRHKALPYMVKELKRSIDSLQLNVAFTVIIVHGNQALESPPVGLKYSYPKAKKRVYDWLDKTVARISTDRYTRVEVTEALQWAFYYRPHIVWVLSSDVQRLVPESLDYLIAKRRGAKINIIQFINPHGQKRVRELAALGQGIAKIVSRDYLDGGK